MKCLSLLLCSQGICILSLSLIHSLLPQVLPQLLLENRGDITWFLPAEVANSTAKGTHCTRMRGAARWGAARWGAQVAPHPEGLLGKALMHGTQASWRAGPGTRPSGSSASTAWLPLPNRAALSNSDNDHSGEREVKAPRAGTALLSDSHGSAFG